MTDILHEDIRILREARDAIDGLRQRAGVTIDLTRDDPIADLGARLQAVDAVLQELAERADEALSARLSMEADLRWYRELFDLAPAAYLVTDSEGVILAANLRAVHLLGMRPDHLIGKSIGTFVAYRGQQSLLPELAEVVHAEVRAREIPIRPWGQEPRSMTAEIARTPRHRGDIPRLRWILHETPGAAGISSPVAAGEAKAQADVEAEASAHSSEMASSAIWDDVQKRLTAVVADPDADSEARGEHPKVGHAAQRDRGSGPRPLMRGAPPIQVNRQSHDAVRKWQFLQVTYPTASITCRTSRSWPQSGHGTSQSCSSATTSARARVERSITRLLPPSCIAEMRRTPRDTWPVRR